MPNRHFNGNMIQLINSLYLTAFDKRIKTAVIVNMTEFL